MPVGTPVRRREPPRYVPGSCTVTGAAASHTPKMNTSDVPVLDRRPSVGKELPDELVELLRDATLGQRLPDPPTMRLEGPSSREGSEVETDRAPRRRSVTATKGQSSSARTVAHCLADSPRHGSELRPLQAINGSHSGEVGIWCR